MWRQTASAVAVVLSFAASASSQVDDHLKCYKIKDPIVLVGVVDLDTPQFGPESGCTVSKAKLFCVPEESPRRHTEIEAPPPGVGRFTPS